MVSELFLSATTSARWRLFILLTLAEWAETAERAASAESKSDVISHFSRLSMYSRQNPFQLCQLHTELYPFFCFWPPAFRQRAATPCLLFLVGGSNAFFRPIFVSQFCSRDVLSLRPKNKKQMIHHLSL